MWIICECSTESRGQDSSSGLLGHVTREQALVCLENCPLLADLAEWSHWDVVFQPALKDLKDFIQKHGGVYQCTTLGKVASVCCKHLTVDRQDGHPRG